LLNEYPTMVIELSSHTDSQGKTRYNEDLSERRAQSARNWLLDRGIEPNRIKPKGYGESQILNRCVNGVKCRDKEHRLNRRTEFKILSGPKTIEIKKTVTKGSQGSIQKKTPSKTPALAPSRNLPEVKFKKAFVDLGEIKRDEFTNTGSADLNIEVVTACKCTDTEPMINEAKFEATITE